MAVNSDDNQRYGDQQDSPSYAGQNISDLKNQLNDAKNVADAGKGAGEAAKTGAEMANAATSTAATAGAELASNAAAGSAVGPVGTAVGVAWGLRHTIAKVIGVIGVFFLAILCLLYSLPEVVYNSVLGLDSGTNEENLTIESNYIELSNSIQDVIDRAYAESVRKAENLIQNGRYDYEISLLNLKDNAKATANYDVANILATYSVMCSDGITVSRSDMVQKLEKHIYDFFPVTSEVKKEVTIVPTEYWTYKAQVIPVVTKKIPTGTIDGVTQYQYRWENKTVYNKDKKHMANEPITVDRYRELIIETGEVINLSTIINVHNYTCYEKDGVTTVSPTETEVEYLAVTIGSFDSSVLQKAFDYSPDELYGDTNMTNAEVVELKTDGLKSLLYGNYASGSSVPVTNEELLKILDSLECNATRKSLVQTGLSLVGKVPYFWGGKSAAGWNSEWGHPKLVTGSGNITTGTIQPYGLDCTGFTDWVYKTTLGITLYEPDKYRQVRNCHPITENELKPGDLGFLMNSDGVTSNHALMFVGYDENRKRVWVHCTIPDGVVVNTPYYDNQIKLYRPNNVDYGSE